jgi:hypothetical protein
MSPLTKELHAIVLGISTDFHNGGFAIVFFRWPTVIKPGVFWTKNAGGILATG